MSLLFSSTPPLKKENSIEGSFSLSSLIPSLSTKASKPKPELKKPKEDVSNYLDLTQQLKIEKNVTNDIKKKFEKAQLKNNRDKLQLSVGTMKEIKSIETKFSTQSPNKELQGQPIKKPPQPPHYNRLLLQYNRNYDEIKKDPEKLRKIEGLLKKLRQTPLVRLTPLNNEKAPPHFEKKKPKMTPPSSTTHTPRKSEVEKPKIIEKPKPKPTEGKKGVYNPLAVNTKGAKSEAGQYNPLQPKKISAVPIREKPSIHESEPKLVKKKKTEDSKSHKKYKDRYDNESESEDENDEISDARAELAKILGGYRKKVQARDYSDESDMEAGFDEIEEEERYSRRIAEKEDAEEYERIKMEKLKKKKK